MHAVVDHLERMLQMHLQEKLHVQDSNTGVCAQIKYVY